jgi:exodeoxyribonuclease V alpha subunit
MQKEIVVENRNEDEWVYLYPFYRAESNVASRLIRLKNFKNVKYIKNFKNEIAKQESKLAIKLSDKQFEAIEQINENNVCIITGGPGTGKTTIIKCLLELYKSHGKKVVLCAPTGRAAKRMTETTGEEAKTIHRLLEIGKIEDDKLGTIDEDIAPIDADVLVIDEMSMVDIFLMNYIVKALFLGSKLVLVGDSNQLPSVGPGSILKDLIESEQIPTVSLNKIFRQAAKSKIIVNAHNVNNGINFIGKNDYEEDSEEDFFYINESNQDKMLYQIISLCKERLKKYGNYDFFTNIQVLTPTKKGKIGTKELNKSLQEALNPANDNIQEKTYGGVIFREGDRVMQIKNNYDIYWEKGRKDVDIKYENGSGIFNGELGRIAKIDYTEKQIEVDFDDKKTAWYAFSELEQLEHAYSITIHKAQRKRV